MSICFYSKNQTFLLQTKNSTYALSIINAYLQHIYWGPTLTDCRDLPGIRELTVPYTDSAYLHSDDHQEYRAFGGFTYTDPALKVRFSDGTRDAFLQYQSHRINGETLEITLRDPQYPLEVFLLYQVRPEFDLIERSSVIHNLGSSDIVLEQMHSATWWLPRRNDWRLTWFTGRWGAEYQIHQQELFSGQRILETRSGFSGPDSVPFLMLDEASESTEEHGGVYFLTLEWSGDWKMTVDRDRCNRVTVTGGINPFDSEWCLTPGESFETPRFTGGYSLGGFGGVSRNLHDYQRQIILHPAERERLMPVVYNAYGTFYSAVDEDRIFTIVDKAQEIGVELLVIDAGWSGTGPAEEMDYRKGMGDWNINPDRFPHGLKPLADDLHRRGMLFGLWMEPECVHPESQLAKEHPEWIAKYDNRPFDGGIRWILNFANDEAADYITQKILKLIEENDLDYFKIDFNRSMTHLSGQNVETKHQKETRIRYIRNLYRCYNTVKEHFPNLLFENCAGGGQRVDLGMARFSGRINRSDNQDTLDMICIHEGFSYFMLPKFAGGGCHISDIYSQRTNKRITTMEYQAHAAMMGSMSIGKNLKELTVAETAELRSYTDQYKAIRHLVDWGDFYRLVSMQDHPYAAYEAMAKDQSEGVVFLFGRNMQFSEIPERLRLRGLNSDWIYSVDGIGTFTGRGLMTVGLPILLEGDLRSQVIRFAVTEDTEL